MKIHTLGVGTPTPAAASWGSSFLVEHGDERLMFDCGPAATSKMVQAGTLPTDVTQLFLTHLHFDHVVDVPALLLSRWDQGAGLIDAIDIYGPQPTSRFIEDIVGPEGLFRDDINARIQAPTSQAVFTNRGGVLPRPRPRVNPTEIAAGDAVGNERWRVRSSHAQHVQPFLNSLAYRMDTDAGSVVFTGDTEPCDPVRELATGADVLFSMCWDFQSAMDDCGENNGQTGTVGAGEVAREAGVKKLVLVHHGPQLESAEARSAAIAEVEREFDGEIIFADEGDVVELS